jgi:hypothetical protein
MKTLLKKGLERDQFNHVLEHVDGMRNRNNRTITQAIAVYLFWLKNGIDQTTISAIFGIKCQRDVSRYLAQAREGLSSFVEKHIGAKVLSRQQLIRCNSNIAA